MKIGTIILLLLLQLHSFAQTNIKAILDTVLLRSRETSMYSATVNWDSLQVEVYKKAENAKTIQELKPAFETLLNGLKGGVFENSRHWPPGRRGKGSEKDPGVGYRTP
ncbi:MAG: hypothetical protein NTW29_15130 [Bacteroidetes bacterium]|nr:hypothetical protein [Bacteroidota bacterium]